MGGIINYTTRSLITFLFSNHLRLITTFAIDDFGMIRRICRLDVFLALSAFTVKELEWPPSFYPIKVAAVEALAGHRDKKPAVKSDFRRNQPVIVATGNAFQGLICYGIGSISYIVRYLFRHHRFLTLRSRNVFLPAETFSDCLVFIEWKILLRQRFIVSPG